MMRYDCVVIPGWGALVASNIPAQLSQEHIIRPKRLLCFNSSITHNDALLATSLARRHNISYDEACKLIADNVIAFKHQLSVGTEVTFGHLGFFKVDDNNKLIFIPTFKDKAHDDLFGLRDFEFPVLSKDNDKLLPETVSRNIFSRRGFKAAASIAALVAIGALLSTPVIVDKSSHNASLNIASVKTKPTAITVKPVAKTTSADTKISVIDIPSDKTNSTTESAFNEGMPSDENGTYFLVINSCKKEHQAQALIKQYAKKGIKAKTIARSGFHHVVVAQSSNQQELIKAKKLLPEKYRKAWVCK